jgi:hypothetical protein
MRTLIGTLVGLAVFAAVLTLALALFVGAGAISNGARHDHRHRRVDRAPCGLRGSFAPSAVASAIQAARRTLAG